MNYREISIPVDDIWTGYTPFKRSKKYIQLYKNEMMPMNIDCQIVNSCTHVP